MLTLVPSFVALVEPLGWTMQARSFRSLFTPLTGWISAARRTITGMLMAAGLAGRRQHAAYHRFFAAARWSLDELGLLLFGLLAPWPEPGPEQLTLDETLARKRGLKIFGAGMHHDPHFMRAGVAWDRC